MASPLPLDVPSRQAFYAAFTTGDLVTIKAFLSLPTICHEVRKTDTYIATHKPQGVSFIPAGTLGCPWYYEPKPTPRRPRNRVSLLSQAARGGHGHVIAWFYAPERMAAMGATMALLLPLLTLYDDSRIFDTGKWHPNVQVLDILLSSPAFCDSLTPEAQQRVLDEVAARSHHAKVVAVAIAHGARLETARTLELIARYAVLPDLYDQIVLDGAFVVGADVMAHAARQHNARGATCLVRHGADSGNGTAPSPLMVAAEDMSPFADVARVLVEQGFADVDTRRATDNATTLMVAAGNLGSFPEMYRNTSRTMVALLLKCGADIGARDVSGSTAMDYAARAGNDAVVRLLRAHGAVDSRPTRLLRTSTRVLYDPAFDTEFIHDDVALAGSVGASPRQRDALFL